MRPFWRQWAGGKSHIQRLDGTIKCTGKPLSDPDMELVAERQLTALRKTIMKDCVPLAPSRARCVGACVVRLDDKYN